MPEEMLEQRQYYAAVETGDVWICYPWEAEYVFHHTVSAVIGQIMLLMSGTIEILMSMMNWPGSIPLRLLRTKYETSTCPF